MAISPSKKILLSVLSAAIILCGCTNTEITENPDSTDSSDSSVPSFSTDLSSSENNSDAQTDSDNSVPEEPEKPQLDPDYESFSAALDKAFNQYYVTGMSVAVFKDDEILYTYSNGYADEENGIAFTENTRSRIASISKMVTSMIMMTLYDEGKITPDSVLSEVTGLPFDVAGQQPVKLWHLMTHTAGFVDISAFTSKGSQDLNYLLSRSRNGYEPGTVYSYTNFGAGTAGAVIERLTGEYFYDYADRILFKPLGMDAGYNIEMISDKESVAKLYDYDGTVTDVQHWNRNKAFYNHIGLGNSCYCAQCELIINVKDLARLGMLMTNDGTIDGVTILSPGAVDLMEQRYFSTGYYDMGLSVRIYDDLIDGRTIYGHNGIAFGAITGLYYDPIEKTGIAIITNGCYPSADEEGFYMINKASMQAAYEYVFDTGDCAKDFGNSEVNNSDGSVAV